MEFPPCFFELRIPFTLYLIRTRGEKVLMDYARIEKKWQQWWQEKHVYDIDLTKARKPFYNLVMFPYPSGEALHIGHWYNYGGIDTYGRFLKMQGYDVFQPMGFDAFGLPAENFAIKHGVPPAESTEKNIKKMREQIKALGGMFHWEYEVNTSHPQYYRWTQWLFLHMYKKGLARQKQAPVNWCPACQTVLANEQVINGCCERCKSEVIQKDLKQWFWQITEYASRLLQGLEQLDWPETTKHLQEQWIGEKQGIEITYTIEGSAKKVVVFTTRPDTNFGATFIVIAPEHPLVSLITKQEHRVAVQVYQQKARKKNEQERLDVSREKTGVFTGSYAINDLTGYRMPVYVADYALMQFGTGAVVGVPGHDKRDWEFATKFGLDIKRVVVDASGYDGPIDSLEKVFEDEGEMVNSSFLNGLHPHQAIPRIMDYLEEQGMGKRVTTYRLKDWLISRQRYWGAPIPIIYCQHCGTVPVPEKDLPVLLPPKLRDYKPKGKSPLRDVPEFVTTVCPVCGEKAERETDTMDTFVCSSWYWMRYLDSQNKKEPFTHNKKFLAHWLPVHMYLGGIEHACLHLLYARFVNMVLFDFEYIPNQEPFAKLRHQGLIIKDGAKMSKSKGNVVNPDEFVEQYGSDVFRMYLLFMGPYEEGGDFSDRGIVGIKRFLEKVEKLIQKIQPTSPASQKKKNPQLQSPQFSLVHKTIQQCGEDFSNLRFNTVIAKLMEYSNWWLEKFSTFSLQENQAIAEILLKLLAPLAPHTTEELWHQIGHQDSIHTQAWPTYDPALIQEEVFSLVIQINGKIRAQVPVKKGSVKAEMETIALQQPRIKELIQGKEIKKVIIVPDRLVNIVV